MGIEDKRSLRVVGWRLLGLLCLYFFGATLLLAVILAVPFVRQAMPGLIEQAEAGETLDQNLLLQDFDQFIADNKGLHDRSLYIVTAVVAVLGALIFLPGLRREESLKLLYSPRAFSWPTLTLTVAAMMGLNFVGSFVTLGTEWLFNAFGFSILQPNDAADAPMYYVFALLIAPVCEEVMFRGGVLRALKPYGRRFALVASSVCFAFFHGNLHQLPGVLLTGLALGYLYLATDSLLMPTLAHMAMNALVTGIWALMDQYDALALPILLIGLVGGLWALKRLRARLGPVAPDEGETSRELRSAFYFTLPMVLFFTLCLYIIVSSVSAL